VPHGINRPLSTRQESVEAGVVLVAGLDLAASLNHTADAVPRLANDPPDDQDREVLGSRLRETRREGLKKTFESLRDGSRVIRQSDFSFERQRPTVRE